jgi:hypothetical protein
MMVEHDKLARNAVRISRGDAVYDTGNLRVAHISRISVLVGDQDTLVIPVGFVEHREIGAVER